MPFRVTAPLVLAKDQDGKVHHRYEGELIDWLPCEQKTQWVEMGFVAELTAQQVQAVDLSAARRQRAADNAEADRVRQCAEALDDLEIPVHKGRPAARAALEERGIRFSNETIAAAIKARRDVSRTVGMPAYPQVSEEVATP